MQLIIDAVVLTEQSPPGSQPVPWWLRFGGIVAALCAVAALMVLMQTRHRPSSTALWVVVIVVLPILGPTIYLIAQSVRQRRERPER